MVHNLRELAQNTPTAKLTYSISLPNADPVNLPFTVHWLMERHHADLISTHAAWESRVVNSNKWTRARNCI